MVISVDANHVESTRQEALLVEAIEANSNSGDSPKLSNPRPLLPSESRDVGMVFNPLCWPMMMTESPPLLVILTKLLLLLTPTLHIPPLVNKILSTM